MGRPERSLPGGDRAALPLTTVVPSRAVLTELARGFLLMNEKDPGRAARFAATFLREQRAPAEESLTLLPRLPQVRRPSPPTAPAPGWDAGLDEP